MHLLWTAWNNILLLDEVSHLKWEIGIEYFLYKHQWLRIEIFGGSQLVFQYLGYSYSFSVLLAPCSLLQCLASSTAHYFVVLSFWCSICDMFLRCMYICHICRVCRPRLSSCLQAASPLWSLGRVLWNPLCWLLGICVVLLSRWTGWWMLGCWACIRFVELNVNRKKKKVEFSVHYKKTTSTSQ